MSALWLVPWAFLGGNEVWSKPYVLSAEEDNPEAEILPRPSALCSIVSFWKQLGEIYFSVEQKTLSAFTDWRNSLTSWRENRLGFGAPLRKHCWAKQSVSVRGFSAFGPLGRGLLRFLSSPCSHSRRAGFSLAAPFCRRRRCRRGLAPRPTAGGKQGPSVSLQVLSLGAVNNLSGGILREKWITGWGSNRKRKQIPWILITTTIQGEHLGTDKIVSTATKNKTEVKRITVRLGKNGFPFLFQKSIPHKHFKIQGKWFGEMFSFTRRRPSCRLLVRFRSELNETNSPCASCGLLFATLTTCPGGWFTWLISEEQ